MKILNEAGYDKITAKNYSDTYLYNKGSYEKKLFEFMMHAEYISKTDPVVADIKDDLKRTREGGMLVKIIESSNTLLCIGAEALPRAFKVFTAKDIKGDKKTTKLYIDLTGLVIKPKGSNVYEYRRADIGVLTSYLLSGMNAMIYAKDPSKLTNNSNLTEEGCKCFSSLVYYIVDYLRLSSDTTTRSKIIYYACMYYQLNILNMSMRDSIINRSLKLSDMSEQQAKLIDINLEVVKDPYKDIKSFVEGIAAITKSSALTLDVFVDKWMFHIGVGSQFGLELYPAFAQILIYAYVGSYLNHQKTIEKCVGRPMVNFMTTLLGIGSELV